jgi:hypothetical protein
MFGIGNYSLFSETILQPNGGFEEAEVGASTVDPWYLGKSSGQANFTVVDSVFHSGTKSLFIDVVQKATGNFWDIQAVYEHIPVEVDKYYRLTFYARSTSGYKLRASIGIYDNYAELTNTTVSVYNNWERVSMACYNADQTELRLPISSFETGKYFIDDVSIKESPIGGSVVVPTGDSIIIQAITALNPITDNFDLTSFTVTSNKVNVPVKKVALIPSQTNKFALILENKISPDAEVIITHTGGKIFYANTNNLIDDNIIAFTDTAYNFAKKDNSAIRESELATISLFPNPAKNFIQIKGVSGIKEVKIYGIAGQLIQLYKLSSNIMNISELPKGMYIVKITDNANRIYVRKMIKE